MAPIRAILFDADGVMQHSDGGDLTALLLRTLGLVPDDPETFMREVFAAERPAMDGLGAAQFVHPRNADTVAGMRTILASFSIVVVE